MKELFQSNRRLAKNRWGPLLRESALEVLRMYSEDFSFSIAFGDLILLESAWYVTHSGLMRFALRSSCRGIEVEPVYEFSDPRVSRWAFRATVYKFRVSRPFVGYGDADPSNVSPLVHGAEMRVAETRAVNRALRKAYGIGICSAEELGSFAGSVHREGQFRKLPPQPVKGNGSNGPAHSANGNGSRVRDRLCQIIRQHKLDADLVKSYAVDFCGTKTLREASREQVEAFVVQLADQAQKDLNSLVCQLNTYQPKAGAA